MIEVLLAGALAALGILTMLGVFTSGLGLINQGKEVAAATGLGRELMEASRGLAFGEIPVGQFAGNQQVNGFPPAPYPNAEVNNQSFDFHVEVESMGPNLKSIVTEVRWGESSKVVFQTYVAP